MAGPEGKPAGGLDRNAGSGQPSRMPRFAPALVAATLWLPAPPAQALTAEEMAGTYEDLEGHNTCAANPARLDVLRGPDHVVFSWPEPTEIYNGAVATGVTYDLIEERGDTLVLRQEGESRRTDDGAVVVWLLRPTDQGFCWGRTDWPVIRCEHPFRRCGDAPPVS